MINPTSAKTIADIVSESSVVGKIMLYDITFSFPSIIILSVIFFHGQIIFSEPKINPVSSASVAFLYSFSIHDSKCEKHIKPKIEPRKKVVNNEMFNSVIAVTINNL